MNHFAVLLTPPAPYPVQDNPHKEFALHVIKYHVKLLFNSLRVLKIAVGQTAVVRHIYPVAVKKQDVIPVVIAMSAKKVKFVVVNFLINQGVNLNVVVVDNVKIPVFFVSEMTATKIQDLINKVLGMIQYGFKFSINTFKGNLYERST